MCWTEKRHSAGRIGHVDEAALRPRGQWIYIVHSGKTDAVCCILFCFLVVLNNEHRLNIGTLSARSPCNLHENALFAPTVLGWIAGDESRNLIN
jgi:hypothetical protein